MNVLLLLALTITSQTIVASDGPAGPYCAFPGVCRLPDGRLCCVYYNGVAGGHVTWADQREKCGAIAYVTSADEGATWSEPAVLLDTDLDDRDPNISVLNDGRVMLAWFQLEAPASRQLKGDGVYIAEIARDMTIGNPRKLQHDAGGGGPLRDFGDGLLMMGSYHLDQPYILRSPDNGRTWQVFAIDNGGKHLDAETDVIQLADGCYYAVMRGAKCNGHYSTSTDGKNWTTAADIGFELHCPELHRVGDIILLAQRIPATALYWSADECKTWNGPVAVDAVGGAYPGMVTLKDGSVLIVYYEENKESNIRCRKFSVTKNGVRFSH